MNISESLLMTYCEKGGDTYVRDRQKGAIDCNQIYNCGGIKMRRFMVARTGVLVGLVLILGIAFILGPLAEQAVSAPREKTEIVLYALSMGSSSYVVSFGLAELINKYSKWLRVTVMETSGTLEINKLIEQPENRKKSIGHMNPSGFYLSRAPLPPYERRLTRSVVAFQNNFQIGFASLSPKIQTWESLKGERVSLFHKGSTVETVLTKVLKLHGVYDQSKVSYFPFDKSKTALLNRTIAAGPISLVSTKPFIPIPQTEELLTTSKNMYNIPFLFEDLPKIQEGEAIPYGFVKIPKETDPRLKNDWVLLEGKLFWVCHPELDAEIVYEFIRILDEHTKEMGNYHVSAKGWTQDRLGNCDIERKYFHPGALKYFDEHGIKVTFKEPKNLWKPDWLK
jgi:TRAP transporter TAXI family solute receptor